MAEPPHGFPVEFDHRFLGLVAGTDKVFFGLDVQRLELLAPEHVGARGGGDRWRLFE